MDQQNINIQNRDTVRTDGSIVSAASGKIKKFVTGLAVLIVFGSSLAMPLFLSYKAQEKAKEMRVRMDMSQLKNWAQVYQLNNQDYAGFDNDVEIKRVFVDIKSMDGVANIFISRDSSRYCCQVSFSDKKMGTWCVDDSGYVGADGKCNKSNVKCK